MALVILGLSTALQLLAAAQSIQLISITGKWKAWALIAAAMMLMGVRRSITLYRALNGDIVYSTGLTAELVALFISILMLAGVVLIKPIFLKIQQDNKDLNISQQRWRLSVEGGGIAAWEYNCQTHDNQVSEQLIDMLGMTRPFSQNGFYYFNDWVERIHPGDVVQSMQAFNAVLEGKAKEYIVEKRLLHEDGYYIWLLSRGRLVSQSADGKPLLIIGTAEDITERKKTAELLKKNESQYRSLFENAEVSIWNEDMSEVISVLNQLRENGVTDLRKHLKDKPSLAFEIADKVHVFQVNEATLELFGADAKDQFFRNIKNTFGANAIDILIEELCAIWAGEQSFRSEVEFIRLDGRPLFCIISFQIPSNIDDFKSIPVSIIDISDRKNAEDKLKLSSKVFNETSEGISITDKEGAIIDVNPAFSAITGYSREEIIGKNSSILSSGKHSALFFAEMWKELNENGHWQGEVWNRNKQGVLYAELLSISTIFDDYENIVNFIGIFTDITHSKQQQDTLKKMAHYDVLTQLPNRVLLADRFKQALAHSHRKENQFAICFLDLDGFKPINDIHGHEVGDEMLVEVAKRIKKTIREEDTASRQGGDEFVLLLGDIDSFTQCEDMLDRLLESLSQPYVINDLSLSISASIGVSMFPIDNIDLDALVRYADQAMYQAKKAGRNRYHLFNSKQNQLDIQRNNKLQEIELALANDDLCLYYQPKVNMATGEVFGAEALIRWNHPEKGIIPPLQFLPVLEGTDLEIQVGNWVINEALKQLNDWVKKGIDISVSVNISSFHLQHSSFVDNLEMSLAQYPEVLSKKLQLEILESSALSNLEAISQIIKTCISDSGVSVALDDFGTGYSSLTHLRNLPAQTIKIDQTFVRDVLDDPDDLAIIDGVIGLSNSFDREIIAEGVETTEHGLILLIMGCVEAQGYGIARPMPALDFQNWLANYTPNQSWLMCGSKARTAKEKKMKIFRLTLEQWVEKFKNSILSSDEKNIHWPIFNQKHCHCGVWIKRARQEQLFEEHCLNELEMAHNKLHIITGDLFKKHQQEHVDIAREDLNNLIIASDRLLNILGLAE